ncbi:MAG: DNRLRE domain-containing protein [Candidatus Eisenbacteria bacterium]|nr:DNRLRE domain-containing protein [Candidatus Eisenbacteria bacterium]
MHRMARLSLPVLLSIASLLGCGESHEALDWNESVRAGLADPDTLISDSLVVQSADGPVEVSTGLSPYLLAGTTTRGGQELRAETYLRWDVSSVPQGTVTEASLTLYLQQVDLPGSGGGEFSLAMHEVTGAWGEDSLTAGNRPPTDAATIASAIVDTLGIQGGDSVIVLTDVFDAPGNEDFRRLIESWVTDSGTNRGVVIDAAAGSAEGLLRFFSAEGLPAGFGTPFLTPLLVVETADTLLSFEAIQDAFLVTPMGGPPAIPDSLLLVSAGYAHRAAFRLDLEQLLGPSSTADPNLAVIRAVLRLRLEPGQAWSLPAGQSFSLHAYEARIDWSAADPVASAEVIERISTVTAHGGDPEIAIPIGTLMQDLVEGLDRDLLVLANTEVQEAKSVLLRGALAREGRPRVEVEFVRLGGRLP